MSQQKTRVFPLQTLSECVRDLDKACRDLSGIMTEQLDAVITSDAERVMDLTEKNVELQQHFHKKEQALISELKELMPDGSKSRENRFTLEKLKNQYPECGSHIEEWQQLIGDNVNRLQQQQTQLVQLLDFAQEQNIALMRSVYSMQSGKNLHYRQNGEKSGVAPGMAVNQEG